MPRNRTRRPAARPTPGRVTTVRRGSRRGSPQVRLRVGLRADRDGALAVRGPAGAAAGPRPRLVRRDGGRRGHRRRRAARRARRHPRPQRPAARRLDRRADGRRRPADDRGPGAGDRAVPQRRSSTSTTSPCSSGCAAQGGQPVRVPRPPRPVDAGHRRARTRPRTAATRGSPPAATRSAPTRPTTSPPTWSASSAPTSRYGGLEEVFNKALSGKDGSEKYEVGAGNRIPLGDNTTVPAVDGQDLHTTIDRDLQWYTQRVLRQARRGRRRQSGDRGGHGLPHRRGPGAGRRPDVRRRRPRRLAGQRPSGPRRSTSSYEPGSVEKVLTLSALHRRGQGQRRAPRCWCPASCTARTASSTTTGSTALIKLTLAGVLAKSSNVGTVLASDQFGPGELRAYLAKFGLGQPTNVGLGAESRGNLPDPSVVEQPDRRPDRLRPVALGQRRADGRRGQHHRQRRRPGRPDA